ncbi:transglutaminase [Capsulimonas corticalis]|uniref:Transglutaminase n=1 Tax=Capsulimonas corticalis TaxID=2219043 RepID=A0A402CQJ6_9BACT|nr:transglutaminase family protein [Capsulimonas corticalis]BDI32684.1 transglutaminase [Capsulimonas corticalis]
MNLKVSHKTTFHYNAPLTGESFMEVRLRPLTQPDVQECRSYQLTVDPSAPVFQYDLPGELGHVDHFTLRNDPHDLLTLSTVSVVETYRSNPFEGLMFDAGDWEMLRDPIFRRDQAEWLFPTEIISVGPQWMIPELPTTSVFEFGQALSQHIYDRFQYVPGSTDISTPLEEFVAQGRGVCQDYAHYMLAIARSAGVPARYVSGYVFSGADPNTHGGDAMHAWVELLIPHANTWRGFDPTNNLLVGERHIKIASGRDYDDVPPTKGLLRAARGGKLPECSDLDVVVSVKEVNFG